MHLNSRGVGVVRTGPNLGASRRVDNGINGAISASNHQKGPGDDHKDTGSDSRVPSCLFPAIGSLPVVVHPHETGWVEAQNRAKKRSNKCNKLSKNGDGASNHIAHSGDGKG